MLRPGLPSGLSRGRPGPPLFLEKTEARRAGKKFWIAFPSPLIQGSGWPGSPLVPRSGSGTATRNTHYNRHNGLRTCNFHCAHLECAWYKSVASGSNAWPQMIIMYAELPPVWGNLNVTGRFRSVVLQRRPDNGGLVSHLTWCSAEKVQPFPRLWYHLSISFF